LVYQNRRGGDRCLTYRFVWPSSDGATSCPRRRSARARDAPRTTFALDQESHADDDGSARRAHLPESVSRLWLWGASEMSGELWNRRPSMVACWPGKDVITMGLRGHPDPALYQHAAQVCTTVEIQDVAWVSSETPATHGTPSRHAGELTARHRASPASWPSMTVGAVVMWLYAAIAGWRPRILRVGTVAHVMPQPRRSRRR
jgi:hypothetical protein